MRKEGFLQGAKHLSGFVEEVVQIGLEGRGGSFGWGGEKKKQEPPPQDNSGQTPRV